jgi:hypothetical protein
LLSGHQVEVAGRPLFVRLELQQVVLAGQAGLAELALPESQEQIQRRLRVLRV